MFNPHKRCVMSLKVFKIDPNHKAPIDRDGLPARDSGSLYHTLIEIDNQPYRHLPVLVESIRGDFRRCIIQGTTTRLSPQHEARRVALVIYKTLHPNQSTSSFGIVAEASADGAMRFEALMKKFERIMDEYGRQHTDVANNELHALRSAVHGPSHASTSFKPGTHGVHDEMDGGIHAILAQRGALL